MSIPRKPVLWVVSAEDNGTLTFHNASTGKVEFEARGSPRRKLWHIAQWTDTSSEELRFLASGVCAPIPQDAFWRIAMGSWIMNEMRSVKGSEEVFVVSRTGIGGHNPRVSGLFVDPFSELLFGGTSDMTVCVWSLKKSPQERQSSIRTLSSPLSRKCTGSNQMYSVAGFTRNDIGKIFTTGGGGILAWDIPRLCPLQLIKADDGTRFAVADDDHLCLWSSLRSSKRLLGVDHRSPVPSSSTVMARGANALAVKNGTAHLFLAGGGRVSMMDVRMLTCVFEGIAATGGFGGQYDACDIPGTRNFASLSWGEQTVKAWSDQGELVWTNTLESDPNGVLALVSEFPTGHAGRIHNDDENERIEYLSQSVSGHIRIVGTGWVLELFLAFLRTE